MRQLTSARGWEYAYEKVLEDKLASLHIQLEARVDADYQYLCGQIHGIRVAITELSEIRSRFNQDNDADLRE
jgi:hypothetical protein